nr:MAG TPA: hypothetical protein [Caudoviricetes sp.]
MSARLLVCVSLGRSSKPCIYMVSPLRIILHGESNPNNHY